MWLVARYFTQVNITCRERIESNEYEIENCVEGVMHDSFQSACVVLGTRIE